MIATWNSIKNSRQGGGAVIDTLKLVVTNHFFPVTLGSTWQFGDKTAKVVDVKVDYDRDLQICTLDTYITPTQVGSPIDGVASYTDYAGVVRNVKLSISGNDFVITPAPAVFNSGAIVVQNGKAVGMIQRVNSAGTAGMGILFLPPQPPVNVGVKPVDVDVTPGYENIYDLTNIELADIERRLGRSTSNLGGGRRVLLGDFVKAFRKMKG